jgi:hypothetical protein
LQTLGLRKRIPEINRRRNIDIVVGDGNILRRVMAVKIHELDPGTQVQVELSVLDAVIQAKPVGIGRKLIGVAEQAVKGFETMHGVYVIIGIVNGVGLIVSIIISQLDDLVLADGFGIGQRRADIIGMEGIVVILIERIGPVKGVKPVHRVVIPISVIDIRRTGKVKGQGPVWFFELMPVGQIGSVDIKAAVRAGGISIR